jgi:hypothetical protein
MAQVVEHLPSNHKALISSPSTPCQKKEEENKGNGTKELCSGLEGHSMVTNCFSKKKEELNTQAIFQLF